MAGAFLISAAEGIVERLLSQAKDLISNKINDQINLASSFTSDLEDLSQTLEIIHALLHDADQNRKKTSATMLVWLKNLKAVICDAEDLLDELAYEALRRKIEVQDSMVNQPTLVDINIWSCRKLRMLNPTDETEAAFNGSTSLQRLVIAYCELTCLPKGLLQPTLAYLDLEGCPELKAPNPDELRSLTSLKDLTIKSPNPNWGSGWEEGLFCTTSLQRLEIGEFGEEYRYFPWPSTSAASPPWSHFTSLRSLGLWGWPEVKSLPDQLEHLPALETLSICHFSGLESLPEWLSNLTSLQYLGIFSCTLVEERCEEGIGEDWHKIAHIPDLRIDKAWKWKLPITSLES